jgi:hypothetical protein
VLVKVATDVPNGSSLVLPVAALVGGTVLGGGFEVEWAYGKGAVVTVVAGLVTSSFCNAPMMFVTGTPTPRFRPWALSWWMKVQWTLMLSSPKLACKLRDAPPK